VVVEEEEEERGEGAEAVTAADTVVAVPTRTCPHRSWSTIRARGELRMTEGDSKNSGTQEFFMILTIETLFLDINKLFGGRSIVFRDQLRRAVSQNDLASLGKEDDADSVGGPNHKTHHHRDGSFAVEDFPRPEAPGAAAEVPKTPPPPPRRVMMKDDHSVDRLGTIGLIAGEFLAGQDTVLPPPGSLSPINVAGYIAKAEPLEALELGPNDEFEPLVLSPDDTSPEWTDAEREVVHLLATQHATVKTIKNVDWAAFCDRFLYAQHASAAHPPTLHDDFPPDDNHHFNAFVTSTSMLPDHGRKMRCYGSPSQYTVGVVFAMPRFDSAEEEDREAERTHTWSWPSGYSAKTEFNRDSRGNLINGRREAIRSLSTLREYNREYLHGTQFVIGLRTVDGSALTQVPYNEVFLRVGGVGRVVNGVDVATNMPADLSLERGVGLPVALFCRTATFGHLISLLRTRARLSHVLGEKNIRGIPLLYITPEHGVRVLTERHQAELWKIASQNLNPFQNSTIAHRTTMSNTDDESFQQKVDELLDLDESIRQMLTPEELARIAGGFGATDESVATILKQVLMHDRKVNKEYQSSESGSSEDSNTSHRLQDVVNEGLEAAIRSGDYHTSRQLLILYSLVASQPPTDECEDPIESTHASGPGDQKQEHAGATTKSDSNKKISKPALHKRSTSSSMGRDIDALKKDLEIVSRGGTQISTHLNPPPPPPPLDTDRLRSATNSDGLLAVLGAAQVLRAMQDGSAKRRVEESIYAVEEWVTYGEQSMAFRISSWYDQRAAQGDLKIATDRDTQFMAFVSNKAISNRRAFASQLRDAVSATDFTDVRFLRAILEMLSRMHSPCLRLELLQYVLGLDNRYSVAHVARSVELAATCLGIAAASRTETDQ
jgi:hypothetical protein